MSVKPMARAWLRPRSTSRSLTQRSRRRSVVRAVAGVPAGPMRERAWRWRRFSTSGRRDSSSTAARRLVSTWASCRQFSPESSGGSSLTRPLSMPPTKAVEMCTRWGRAPVRRSSSTSRAAPSRLVWAERSAGLSNSTAAAEWMTMSHAFSRARELSSRPRPSRPRSSSRTASFSAARRAKASSPSSAFRRRKAGLERTSFSSRSAAGRRGLERTASWRRPTSGKARRHFSTIDLPRKPVVPVTSTVLPAKASEIKAYESTELGRDRLAPQAQGRRTAGVHVAEVRLHGDPEPVAVPEAAAEAGRAGGHAIQPGSGRLAVLHDLHVEDRPAPGAAPADLDQLLLDDLRADSDPRAGHVREARRAAQPEVAEVTRPGVGPLGGPAVGVHRAPAAGQVDAEVQVLAGRGARLATDAQDLAPGDVLAAADRDRAQVAVEALEAVAVVDDHGLAAAAGVTVGDVPARSGDLAGRRGEDLLVVEPEVVAVVAVVVEEVLLARGEHIAAAERGVLPALVVAGDPVVAADPAVRHVGRAAVVEERGDVVGAEEGQGQKAPGGRLAEVGPARLDRAVGDLGRVAPADVGVRGRGRVPGRACVGGSDARGEDAGEDGKRQADARHGPVNGRK